MFRAGARRLTVCRSVSRVLALFGQRSCRVIGPALFGALVRYRGESNGRAVCGNKRTCESRENGISNDARSAVARIAARVSEQRVPTRYFSANVITRLRLGVSPTSMCVITFFVCVSTTHTFRLPRTLM